MALRICSSRFMLRHAKRVASSSGPRRAVRPSRHPVRDCGGSPFDVHGVRTPAPWPFAPRRAPSGTNGHGDRRTACRPGQPGGEGPPARAPCAAPPGWRHVRMVARASTAAGRTGTRGDNLDCGGGRRAPLRRQLGGAGICEPAAEPAPRRRSRPGDSIGAPDAYLRGQRADPVPHALVITGIVVAVCATGLALTLATRIQALTGSARLETDEET